MKREDLGADGCQEFGAVGCREQVASGLDEEGADRLVRGQNWPNESFRQGSSSFDAGTGQLLQTTVLPANFSKHDRPGSSSLLFRF